MLLVSHEEFPRDHVKTTPSGPTQLLSNELLHPRDTNHDSTS